jgi:hypothetical protein
VIFSDESIVLANNAPIQVGLSAWPIIFGHDNHITQFFRIRIGRC